MADYGTDENVQDEHFDGETIDDDVIVTSRHTRYKTASTNYLNFRVFGNTGANLSDDTGDILEAWLLLYGQKLKGKKFGLTIDEIADLRIAHDVDSIFMKDSQDGTYDPVGKTVLP